MGLFDDLPPPTGKPPGPAPASPGRSGAAGASGPPAPPASGSAAAPLAERLRPRHLDEVVGQQHLLGPGRPLRVAFERGRLHSMVLWGPPGVGKTTLARLVAEAFDARFIALSAVLGGVKDIRDAVEQARVAQAAGRRTVVFVDEVHRFNKAQQDAFLPHVEAGLFTFIGATTENPSFEMNAALLSRATVHVLRSLGTDDLDALLVRAGALLAAPPLTDGARARLLAHADGDARRLLNAFENVAALAAGEARSPAALDESLLERALGELLRRYDKGGDAFYDSISALHKSVRGSDPDAALYWLARMLDGGADPRYLARRLIRMASEDIGLADPRALSLTLEAAHAYERLGSPEGELMLAEAVVFLAVAAKSNAVYAAWNAARARVKQGGSAGVPAHLRNAPTRLMQQLGHGVGYRYAHDEPDGFAAGARYWPDEIAAERFYEPVPRGLEIRIGERLQALREANDRAAGAAVSGANPRSVGEESPRETDDGAS